MPATASPTLATSSAFTPYPPPQESAAGDRPGPALRRLLLLADRSPVLARGALETLCAHFDPALSDAPPVAAITALARGFEPRAHYWLRADPVYLQAQRDDLTVWETSALSPQDADALLATLNDFLATDSLALRAASPQEWLLALSAPPELDTTPLPRVIGAPMGHHLPRGNDARAWLGRMTEWQMLLHEHPVNARREAQGMTPVNALWLWGGGVLPGVTARPFDLVCVNDTLGLGLARCTGATTHALPVTFEAMPPAQNALLVFDRDIDYVQLDSQWFEPLLQALRGRRVERLDIVISGQTTHRYQLRPGHLWRFWRRLTQP